MTLSNNFKLSSIVLPIDVPRMPEQPKLEEWLWNLLRSLQTFNQQIAAVGVTVGSVDGSALTDLSAIPSDAGVIPTANLPTTGVQGPATNTDNNIPQWDGANSNLLKDGLALGTSANNLVQRDGSGLIQGIGLVIENRTSDPVSPATGQIWLRTDL